MASLRFCSSAFLVLGSFYSHAAQAGSGLQSRLFSAPETTRRIALAQAPEAVTITAPHLRHGSWYLRPGDRLVDGRQIASPADNIETHPPAILDRINSILPNWLRW